MGVQARFYVAELTRQAYNPKHLSVKLQAVSRGDQNKDWAEATPSGQVTMTINNDPAAQWFADRLGQDVTITFEDAVAHTPADGHPYRESLAQAGTAYGPPYCGDCARPESEHQHG